MMLPAEMYVLATRRPSYMRSFPGAWVLPGGSVDPGESLVEAVQREVYEETGISTAMDSWQPECLWESLYPTVLSDQHRNPDGIWDATSIRAHHLVVYLSTVLPSTFGSTGDTGRGLRLCSEEVDGAVCLVVPRTGQDHCNLRQTVQASTGRPTIRRSRSIRF